MTVYDAVCSTTKELDSAREKFGRFASAHEGYAVLLEEVDELWEVVKRKKENRGDDLRKEATQVAAMALCFLCDLC